MATIDSRIPLAFQSPQINSPAQNKLAALAVQGKEMELQQAQRGMQQENALLGLMQRPDFYNESGGINPAMMPEIGRVAPSQALSYSKAIQGQQKALSDAQMAKLNQAKTQLELVGRLVGGVTDEASFQAARQQAQAFGIPLDGVPAQYDPNWVQQTRQQTLTAQQQIDNFYKERGLDLQQQRLNLDREKMGSEASKPVGAPMEVTGPNGSPTLVQRYADGSLRPVEGFAPKARDGMSITTNPDGTVSVTTGAANTKLNEGQSKNLLFGSRAEEANRIINELIPPNGGDGVSPTTARVFGGDGVVGSALNFLAPDDVQRVNQAKRDFINAVLRKESGAVIADSEFLNADRQYFPQPGDSPAVIQQKARNRDLATKGILADVPGSARESLRSSVGPGQQQGSSQGSQQRSITRTGRDAQGRRVAEYSDGSIGYLE